MDCLGSHDRKCPKEVAVDIEYINEYTTEDSRHIHCTHKIKNAVVDDSIKKCYK